MKPLSFRKTGSEGIKLNIVRLKTNHVRNPIGFSMDCFVLSWVVKESTGKKQKAARIRVAEDASMERILFDSGMREEISSLGYVLPCKLEPAARYWWDVTVEADNGDCGTSETAWFETPAVMSELTGEMIACETELDVCEFFKAITIDGAVQPPGQPLVVFFGPLTS